MRNRLMREVFRLLLLIGNSRAVLAMAMLAGASACPASAKPDDDLPAMEQVDGQLLIVGFTGTEPRAGSILPR